MSVNMTLSSLTKATFARYLLKKLSIVFELFAGLLNSRAWVAFINSIAKIRSTLSISLTSLVAPLAPILTWSSCPCDDSMLSTDVGVASCLFWLTMAAAAY